MNSAKSLFGPGTLTRKITFGADPFVERLRGAGTFLMPKQSRDGQGAVLDRFRCRSNATLGTRACATLAS